MPGRCEISQGEQVGRPSFLRVETSAEPAGWRVLVSGDVRIVGDGAFEL